MTAAEKKIRLLIADDHPLIRDGLKKILALHKDFKVLADVANGREAHRLAVELLPDIVLMDVNMPELNGIEATRLIKAACPGVQIIALTIHDEEEYVIELVKAGVSAYLLKDTDTVSLVETIRAVFRGEAVFHPKITRKLLGEFQRLSGTAEERLSPRETEVLVLLAGGRSNKEIAQNLFISEKTVKNHISQIFRKINVADRTQAALYAVKNRLVKL
ncbi:MAG: response regulator transcription factor [Dethiobacter sp.]|nr:response regulator transcription factor [Dethiobacter sp.]MCL5982852.1 response regulator transcription factor [Bacillota bacterium]